MATCGDLVIKCFSGRLCGIYSSLDHVVQTLTRVEKEKMEGGKNGTQQHYRPSPIGQVALVVWGDLLVCDQLIECTNLGGSVPLCVQQSQEQLTHFWIQSCVSRTWLQMFGLLLLLLLAKPCLSSWGDSSSYHQVLHPCSAYPTFNLSHSGLLTPLSRVNGK